MRHCLLWSLLLLALPLGPARAQNPKAFRSQADFAREADSVRVAYRDSVSYSNAKLVRQAKAVRAAYCRTGPGEAKD